MPQSNLNHLWPEAPPEMADRPSPWAVHRDDVPIEGGFDPQYGDVTWQTLICNSRMASSDLVLGIAHIPAYGGLPLHRHEPAEFYYFTAGDGEVLIDGQVHPVCAGTAIFIPANAEHGITAGPNGTEFLYGFPESRFDGVTYVFSQKQEAEQ